MKRRYSRREFVRKTSLAPLELSALAWLSKSSLGATAPAAGETLWNSFLKPPDEARIMMRWWWFGPAVTHEELEREMRAMKEGGIGGFEIQPVYPLALEDPSREIRDLPYLSDAFLEALRFVNQKSRELGMRLDLTLCSGWPYGGSRVPAAQAAGMLRVVRVELPDGENSVPVPSVETGESLIAAWAVRDHQEQLSGTGWHQRHESEGNRATAIPRRTVLYFQPDGHAGKAPGCRS
jgi:hypothetical protein